ncbi:MAG: DeoR/GlpR transcriptional regulator [Clostridia bacterium]|nr:DeoR/GlpR transcriptional regulator [Clostridia bacterium]
MFYSKRHEDILKILKEREAASVHFLAKALFVSEPTVRRDLDILQKQGRVRRTFGGAVICELLNREVPLSLREREGRGAKAVIAERASDLLSDGQVIFLDASSTTSYLVEYIAKYNDMTVITNSPKTSLALAEKKVRSFCTGGLMLENSIAYVGSLAESFVKNFNADIFFFSCRGVSDDGRLTDSSLEESELRKVMMENSKKIAFLCTSDKIGKKYMYNLCRVQSADHVFCDDEEKMKNLLSE